MQITPTEKKLFKEAVIREYRLKHEQQKKRFLLYNDLLVRLKKVMPINVAVGLIACAVLVYFNGWKMFLYLLLSGIIWLTLITTVVSTFLNPK